MWVKGKTHKNEVIKYLLNLTTTVVNIGFIYAIYAYHFYNNSVLEFNSVVLVTTILNISEIIIDFGRRHNINKSIINDNSYRSPITINLFINSLFSLPLYLVLYSKGVNPDFISCLCLVLFYNTCDPLITVIRSQELFLLELLVSLISKACILFCYFYFDDCNYLDALGAGFALRFILILLYDFLGKKQITTLLTTSTKDYNFLKQANAKIFMNNGFSAIITRSPLIIISSLRNEALKYQLNSICLVANLLNIVTSCIFPILYNKICSKNHDYFFLLKKIYLVLALTYFAVVHITFYLLTGSQFGYLLTKYLGNNPTRFITILVLIAILQNWNLLDRLKVIVGNQVTSDNTFYALYILILLIFCNFTSLPVVFLFITILILESMHYVYRNIFLNL